MHKITCQIIFVFNILIDLIIFFNPFFKASPSVECSNLALSTTTGLYPKVLPVKYSCLLSSLDDNADI